MLAEKISIILLLVTLIFIPNVGFSQEKEEYIVFLRDDHASSTKDSDYTYNKKDINFSALARSSHETVDTVLLFQKKGLIEDVQKVYKHSMSAVQVTVLPKNIAQLSSRPEVLYVERNQYFYRPEVIQSSADILLEENISAEQRYVASFLDPNVDRFSIAERIRPWGLYLIGLSKDSGRRFPEVHAYVVDEIVEKNHPALNVVEVRDFVEKNQEFSDDYYLNKSECFDHATHVAGIIGADPNYSNVGMSGVVPGASIHSIRVLNCEGATSLFIVLEALEYIAETIQYPAVVNLSFAGDSGVFSDIFRLAIQNLSHRGAVIVLAAGNEAENACSYFNGVMGKHPGVISVGAVNRFLFPTSFSNYGGCVSLWAPGENILSTKYDGYFGYLSGTSMAAPFVAGAALLYMADHQEVAKNPIAVKKYLEYQSIYAPFYDASRSAMHILNVAALLKD